MYLGPSVGFGRKPPTDQHHEFHERASSGVLSKSFPRQQGTTQTRATEQSTDHERVGVLLKDFPRHQQRTTRRVGGQYTDHERADFLWSYQKQRQKLSLFPKQREKIVVVFETTRKHSPCCAIVFETTTKNCYCFLF